MNADTRPIQDYMQARKAVMDYFSCDGDFFIRPLLGVDWIIKGVDDFYILTYWKANGAKTDAVIVKKSGQPMIFETSRHTMVVGIDCVKIGFIFLNENKQA